MGILYNPYEKYRRCADNDSNSIWRFCYRPSAFSAESIHSLCPNNADHLQKANSQVHRHTYSTTAVVSENCAIMENEESSDSEETIRIEDYSYDDVCLKFILR